MFCLFRDTADSDRKRKRTTEDKSKSGAEEKRRKKDDGMGTEVEEPETKKKKQCKDGSSSDDEEVPLMFVCFFKMWRKSFNIIYTVCISFISENQRQEEAHLRNGQRCEETKSRGNVSMITLFYIISHIVCSACIV